MRSISLDELLHPPRRVPLTLEEREFLMRLLMQSEYNGLPHIEMADTIYGKLK